MPYSNDPAAWQNFYPDDGDRERAITGLVFVASRSTFAKSSTTRSSSRERS
jgi:hypothetical protein